MANSKQPTTKKGQSPANYPNSSTKALHDAEQKHAFDRDFENPERLAKDGVPGDLAGGARQKEENPQRTPPVTWGVDVSPYANNNKVTFWRRLSANKKWLAGGGIISLVMLIPIIFITLLPLKLEMFVRNITSISVKIPGFATETRLEDLVLRALAARAIIAANPEGDLRAKTVYCKGGGIACSLFSTYTTEYFEKKLDITLDIKEGGRVGFGGRASEWSVGNVDPGKYDVNEVTGRLESKSNGEIRKIIRQEVAEKGKHNSIVTRYLARKFLMKKYGVRLWRGPPFVEKSVNAIDNAKISVKTAIYKATIGKISPRIAIYLACISGEISVCEKLHANYKEAVASAKDAEDKNPANDPDVDKDDPDYQKKQAAYDAGAEARKALSGLDIGDDVTEQLTKGLFTKKILAVAGVGVAVAGVLDLIFKAVGAVDKGALEQIGQDMSLQVYTGFATEVATIVEKKQAGDLDAYSFQAMMELFDEAERSPLQQAENGLTVDTSSGITAECNGVDGTKTATVLAQGQLICDEQKVIRNYTEALQTNPAWKSLAATAGVWNGSAGLAFDFVNGVVGDFLSATPGFNELMGFLGDSVNNVAGDQIAAVMEWMIGLVFEPQLTGPEATGPENYVALSGGIRNTQNATMEQGVDTDGTAMGGGGSVLSTEQTTALVTKINKQNEDDFNSQPLLARIFDLSLPSSFASQFISKMPTSINALAKLPMNSIGQTLMGDKVSAASTTDIINPFNMTLYGYAIDDPVLSADPSIYTEAYCATSAAERLESFEKRDGELVATYHKSDPCALEKMVVGVALNAEGVTDDPYSLKDPDEGGIELSDTDSGDSLLAAVVNKSHPNNPLKYAPKDLVDVPKCSGSTSWKIRAEAAAAFEKMSTAAKSEGIPKTICSQSAYRSYDAQVTVYDNRKNNYGQAEADKVSARAGHSEHQTGLAVDIIETEKVAKFENTPEGKWLAANSYKYGFVLRYPSGETATTGYDFEPWHYRYIGVGAATDMHNKGIKTLEKYYNVTGGTTYAYTRPANKSLLSVYLGRQNGTVTSSLSLTALSMEPLLV